MRRSIAKKGQDICFFCALRCEAASYPSRLRSPPQARAYRSSTPSWRPAGAATAQREDYDDNSYVTPRAVAATQSVPQPPELFWKCKCGHFNQPRRGECTICSNVKPSGAQLVQKTVQSTQTQSPAPPPMQQSRPPVISSTDSNSNVRRQPPASKFGDPSRFRDPAPTPNRAAPEPQMFRQGFGQRQQNPSYQQPAVGDSPTRSRFGSFIDNARQQPQPERDRRIQPQRRQDPAHFGARERPHNPARDAALENNRSGLNPAAPRQSPHNDRRSVDLSRNLAQDLSSPPLPSTSMPGRPKNPFVARGIDQLLQATGATERTQQRPSNSSVFRRADTQMPSRGRYERSEQNGDWNRPGAPASRSLDLSTQSDEAQLPEAVDRTWKLPEKAPPNLPDEPLESFLPPEAIEDAEEEVEFGRRQKGDRSLADRRRERFELDDTVSSSNEATSKRNNGAFGRRDPRAIAFELEMADAEARLLEDNEKARRKKMPKAKKQVQRPRVEIPEFISVENLAKALKIRLEKFVDQLEEEGFEGARYDHVLDAQTAVMFADLNGFDPVILEAHTRQDIVARPPPSDPSILPQRPPIVTIMGHVDHGKTTILDYLRKSSVVASEHGGITQHIGAFSVTMPGTQRSITFLDTPGHAAFLDMRRRGANVTDIVVLVVAADDSVKPQTIEAIKHAKDAGVQMIVAINKIDKDNADVEKVKNDLNGHDVTVEDFDGDIQAIPLSGKTGQGMEALEEAIITLADVSDFRAEADGPAEGAIIESKVTAAGRVATILVRRGTLRLGDFIVAGNTWARVRTLRNDAGQLLEEAPPGTPVQVDGWRGEDPTAGLEVLQADNEQQAKDVVALRTEKMESMKIAVDMAALNAIKSTEAEVRAKVLEWEKEQGWKTGKIRSGRPWDNEGWVEPTASAGAKRVHFVVKADVAGSAEAIVAAVGAIGNNEVVANIVHSGTGHLGESDIRLLAGTGEASYAINFNQPIEGTIHRLAEAANVRIMDHNIIYKVTDQVKEKLADEMPPLITQKVLGEAEIGQVFDITTKKSKVKVAGCKITNGTISRSQKVRVLRDNDVIYTGTLDSLKNVKKDVTEMRKGTECGMSFDRWEDFQQGDKIQCFEETHEKRKLY